MKNLFYNASWLVGSETDGYGTRPIPDLLDDRISSLINEWRSLPAEERAVESKAITEEQSSTLLAYSERMASLAVRMKSQDLVAFGLLALGIDGWQTDWRENTLLLCLHFDASKKIGITPEITFGNAAKLLSPNVATALKEFLQREPQDQSLKSMGYKESADSDGFRYERTW